MADKNPKPAFTYSKVSSREDQLSIMASHKNLIILSFGKLGSHPWTKEAKEAKSDIKEGYSLHVGKESFPGGIIKIRRGMTYTLYLDGESKRKLILTHSPKGGEGAKPLEGFKPLETGSMVEFYVGDNFPRALFYQDAQDSFIGGPIFVGPPKFKKGFKPNKKEPEIVVKKKVPRKVESDDD